jgi:hypothetical protein
VSRLRINGDITPVSHMSSRREQRHHLFLHLLTAEELNDATLKLTWVLVLQFWHLPRHGSRYGIHVSTRGRTAPASRSERREHGSSIQSVPRDRRGAAEDDCRPQRQVRSLSRKWRVLAPAAARIASKVLAFTNKNGARSPRYFSTAWCIHAAV